MEREADRGWAGGKECELMLESKRRKEREAEEFQEMQSRMRRLEESMRKGGDDDFMRQMFE